MLGGRSAEGVSGERTSDGGRISSLRPSASAAQARKDPSQVTLRLGSASRKGTLKVLLRGYVCVDLIS